MDIPDPSPVERFIRDVLPTIPGGRLRITDYTGHLDLIYQAAEDRGLTLRTIGSTTYFYDGRWPVGAMSGWVPTLVGRRAYEITKSKSHTKVMLAAAGVPTPAGVTVGPDEFGLALEHLRSAEHAMVFKPDRGKGASGITTAITTESDLRRAWDAAAAHGSQPPFLLEEQAHGVDIRAYVVGRRVVAAVTRVNAFVVGDGSHTLAELVVQYHRLRDENNRRQANFPYFVDTELLRRTGRSLDDVPAHGEAIALNSLSNNAMGAVSADVTERAHPDLFELAVAATRAIPGLGMAGVDLMTPSIDSADQAVVLEVNVAANIRVHLCPAFGQPRDVAALIVAEMIGSATAPRRRSRRSPSRRPLGDGAGDPVERFVREVLPSVSSNGRQHQPVRSHARLIKRAAKARGLTLRVHEDTTYFYAGRRAVGGLDEDRTTTLNARHAADACRSRELLRQLLEAAHLPVPAPDAAGVDVRVFVVGSRAVAAAARLPAAEAENRTVDVTDLVDPGLLDLAVDATRAVPGLRVAGVDLIVPDPRSADDAVVAGLDPAAGIRLHHHPSVGMARDVAGAIVEEMIATARRLDSSVPAVRRAPGRRPARRSLARVRGRVVQRLSP